MHSLILFILLFCSFYQYAMDVPSQQAAAAQAGAEDSETLFGYIYKGWENFFERKLDNEKIPIESCDERGSTLLHVASAQAQPKIVRILLARGANVHAVSRNTATPPLYEAVNGHSGAPQVVEQLLVHGADPFCEGQYYKITPLYLAAVGGYIPIVRLILIKSRYPIEHKISESENLEEAVKRITWERVQNGKKLLAMQDPLNTCTARQKVEIDLRVLSLKQKQQELQDYEIERKKNFLKLLPLLVLELFEKNFEQEIQDDVRKILAELQKKHK